MTDWSELSKHLKAFYNRHVEPEYHDRDIRYLHKAFNRIEELWEVQFCNMPVVKYLMISEAPLWGNDELYIYHIEKPSKGKFFTRNDLQEVTGVEANNKQELINELNKLNLLILDVSPFALDSQKDEGQSKTRISYNMGGKKYRELIEPTLSVFLNNKLKRIKQNGSSPCVFYRYKRVKESLDELISPYLFRHGFIKSEETDIPFISKEGSEYWGAIDPDKLKAIVKAH